MTVDNMIKRCLARFFNWHFIVESDNHGGIIYDDTNSDDSVYNTVKDLEVHHWGMHNRKEKTIILYV